VKAILDLCFFPGDSKWKTCVRRFRLMPNPHMEEGSQEYFCVGKKQVIFHNLANFLKLGFNTFLKIAYAHFTKDI
jgi:hypothetical protein